jgi:hypothetical protein
MESNRIDALAGANASGLSRAVLAAGGLRLLWKVARGWRDSFWAVLGLGVAAYSAGFWPW